MSGLSINQVYWSFAVGRRLKVEALALLWSLEGGRVLSGLMSGLSIGLLVSSGGWRGWSR